MISIKTDANCNGVRILWVWLSVFMLASTGAWAQQITGEPGSPGATTTISGNQLPLPDPPFGGVIEEKASESKAW